MARGVAAGRRGGGDGIPAQRPDRARLGATTAALALAALVGAYAGLNAVRWQGPTAGLAAAGVGLLALALRRRRPHLVAPGVLLTGAAYGVSVASRDPALDLVSVAIAALLFAVAELAYWALDLAGPVTYAPGILGRRALLTAWLVLAGLCAAGLVAAAARDTEQSLLLEGLGVAAAIAVLAVLARLARARR
jgi:hypothetical protein